MDFITRIGDDKDILALYKFAERMNANNEAMYFDKCFDEVRHNKRIIVIIESASSSRILGYGQLIWSPIYAPFKKQEIPEIQDLNVIADARGKGIGSAMMEFLEAEAKKAGYSEIGIGVGVIARFGAAQRLYINKGYIPNGLGACYDDEMIEEAAIKPIDELLSIKLTKKIQ